MVVALSAAEMPVVTPCAASMDRVKLVLNLAPFLSLMSGKSSCWQRASVKVKHTNPRACVIIKLIASGVMWLAAMIKSPSFSRSSSSIKMTILPALMSSMISWVLFSAIRLPYNVLIWCIDFVVLKL